MLIKNFIAVLVLNILTMPFMAAQDEGSEDVLRQRSGRHIIFDMHTRQALGYLHNATIQIDDNNISVSGSDRVIDRRGMVHIMHVMQVIRVAVTRGYPLSRIEEIMRRRIPDITFEIRANVEVIDALRESHERGDLDSDEDESEAEAEERCQRLEAERIRQNHAIGGGTRGMAYEIHDYSDTQVTTGIASSSSSSAGSATATKTLKLIDAVFKDIEDRLKDTKLIAYPEAQRLIEESIEQFIPEAQRAQAKEAAFDRLASDTNYEHQISLVVTFLQTFHKDKMPQWVDGFVRESIEAYKGRSNSTSCNPGISERSATGLRGIDAELDKLFTQVEGPIMFKNWLKTWDLPSIDNNKKQKLAEQLKVKGITQKSNVEEVSNAFRGIAEAVLSENGLQNNQDMRAEIDAYADSMFEAYYEKELKPYMVHGKYGENIWRTISHFLRWKSSFAAAYQKVPQNYLIGSIVCVGGAALWLYTRNFLKFPRNIRIG